MSLEAATPYELGLDSQLAAFRHDVVRGLNERPKHLPCKYFYDRHGSALFDAICELDEYYLTRTELRIMQQYAAEMAAWLGEDFLLAEFGSGSSIKTRILLNHLRRPAAYVPIDISREHLLHTAEGLRRIYPHIEIMPLCADFTADFELPRSRRRPARRVVYFPGSTIGNFTREEAYALLCQIRDRSGDDGGLLIGIDLQKDASVLEAAYNDAAGVTAQFNLNLLRRINRELGANFDLAGFEHHAFYDRRPGRVEIGLVSQRRQQVQVAGQWFHFAAGEWIRTEYSHKYSIDGFVRLASAAGWRLRQHWTDPREFFGILYFEGRE